MLRNTHGHPSTQAPGHTVITVPAVPTATVVVTQGSQHHGHHHHHHHGHTTTVHPMPVYSQPNPYAGLMFAAPVHGHHSNQHQHGPSHQHSHHSPF